MRGATFTRTNHHAKVKRVAAFDSTFNVCNFKKIEMVANILSAIWKSSDLLLLKSFNLRYGKLTK